MAIFSWQYPAELAGDAVQQNESGEPLEKVSA